jgi:PIN domain nuclease of toxin-antitoxin system
VQIISNPDNKCYVSIATFWEIAIKTSLGRLDLKADLSKIFQIIEDSGFDILPITVPHIITNSILPFHHQDPFDRIIISQAIVEDLTVISKDNQFSKYNINIVWDSL